MKRLIPQKKNNQKEKDNDEKDEKIKEYEKQINDLKKELNNLNKNLLIEKKNNSNINNEYRYITLEESERKDFLESKKKWISKEDFHRFFGLHTTALKPIPNAMENGTPISKYKYREEFPDKWLTSNGFVV